MTIGKYNSKNANTSEKPFLLIKYQMDHFQINGDQNGDYLLKTLNCIKNYTPAYQKMKNNGVNLSAY